MEEQRPASAGKQFVKKIRPIGCVLFLSIGLLTFLFCIFSKGLPVEGYTASNTSEYYEEHLDELKTELEENLFPLVDGVLSCEMGENKLIVSIDAEKIAVTRSNILHYYDNDLFDFVKVETSGE